MSDDGTFVLKWDLHEETRTSTLKSLWKNGDFLDVTLACDDGQIDAHKVIMSAASPFFESILKRNPHNHPLLYLRGTAKKDIQSLLIFIYSGETQVHEEELNDFMSLASSLQIQGLAGELPGITKGKDDESFGISDTSRKKEEDIEVEYGLFIEPSKIMEERLPQKIISTADAEEGLTGEVMGNNEGKDDESIQNKRTPKNKKITRKKKRSEKSKDERYNTQSKKKTTFRRTPQPGNKQTTRNEEKSEKSNYERYDASSKIIEKRLAPTALVESKWSEKDAKSRKTPTLIEDELSIQEDLQIVELSDDIGDSEHDMSDIIKKYTHSEDDVSFRHPNKCKTSFTEYDDEVMGFLAKCGRGDVWTCTGCTYSSNNKSHMKEHAEKHVKGYSLVCDNCGKACGRKKYLRQHKAKCTNEGSEISWM